MHCFPRHTAFLLVLITGLFLGCPVEGAIRVFLVGIAKSQDSSRNLPSVENDVALLQKTFTDRLGVAPENLLTLSDAQATREGMVSGFTRHLIKGCRPEDVAVFYFCGHGSSTEELGPDSDEEDGRDELLCPYDYDKLNPATFLTDDTIYSLLQQVPARHMLIAFDCCFAGTATRGFSRGKGASDLLLDPEFANSVRGIDEAFNWTRSTGLGLMEAPVGNTLKEKTSPENQVFISACAADERARNVQLSGQVKEHGVLTLAFTSMLQAPEFDSPLDIAEGYLRQQSTKIYHEINPEWKPQTPSIESARRDFSLKSFLGGQVFAPGPVPGPRPRPVPAPPGKLQITLDTHAPLGGYRHTQALKVTATLNQPGYLRLYYVAADRQITQIYPNRDQPLRKLTAGETLTIPSAKSQLRLGPPKGRAPEEIYVEGIIAVASPTAFTDAEATTFATGRYHGLPERTPVPSLLSRSIEIEARQRGDFGYEVKMFQLIPPTGK